MNHILLFALIISLSAVLRATAQLPAHPVPMVEVDVRENSIRMRSAELERLKQESEKPRVDRSGIEGEIKFARIKAAYEGIQKARDSVVRAFKTGKVTDYSKIRVGAKTIVSRASQLNTDLFGAIPENSGTVSLSQPVEQRSIKTLIIELDDAIARFVSNEIFQNTRVVERRVSEDAQNNLQQIMKLSDALFKQAKRMENPGKVDPGSQ